MLRRALWLVLPLAACGGGGNDPDAGAFRGGPAPSGPFFETSMFFDRVVAGDTPADHSADEIAALRAAGGWGNGDKMQIDFSFNVLGADAGTTHRAVTQNGDWSSPDCDEVDVPMPAGGNVEGNDGYTCEDGGDCHLLVMDTDAHALYEVWEADLHGDKLGAGCVARWDTKQTYTDTLRGDQCTSADAAGLPIAPLLFTADELAAGKIDHAIRFILPNDRVQQGFVRPATHGTFTTGGAAAPSYGVHLRLRADFPLESLPSEGARVVARAMQKYGMYHADGGNIALTARSDRDTVAKWDGLLDSHDLKALRVEDFDVMDHGAPLPLTLDCAR